MFVDFNILKPNYLGSKRSRLGVKKIEKEKKLK